MLAGLVVLQWHCFVNCLLTHCKAKDNTQTQVFCYNLRQELFTLQCTTTATGPCYLSLLLVPGHFLLFHSGHCHSSRLPSYVFCIWMLIFAFWMGIFALWMLIFAVHGKFARSHRAPPLPCFVTCTENDIVEMSDLQMASCPTTDVVDRGESKVLCSTVP